MISRARGLFRTSEAASISSVVVMPLPHSWAISRKGALVTAAIGGAPPETSKAVMRLTIASSKEQLLRERAWTISQGWESEPEKLPAIETLL